MRRPRARSTDALAGLERSGDDVEDRRLPGAVGADDGEPVAGLDAQRDAADDDLGAVGDRDVVEREERHALGAGHAVRR